MVPVLVRFHSFGVVHAESTGLVRVGNRRVVTKGTGIRQICPHNRVTSKGKRLGMTVPTPGHRDVGRAPKGVEDLVLFISVCMHADLVMTRLV